MKRPIPRTDSGTPPREERASSGDFHLPNLLDATDDEDSGEDTDILITSVQHDAAHPFQAFAVYIQKKHSRLAKRVAGLEMKIDRAVWTISGALILGGAAWEFAKVMLSHIK